MTTARPGLRENQRLRTRKDLLEAAARLVRQGRNPSLEEVAEAAMISRATAYRYFPSVEALLSEAPLDVAMPEPGDLFARVGTDDPVARVKLVDAAVAQVIANEATALRMMLVHSLQFRLKGGTGQMPARQNRRTPLIEAALEPVRKRLGADSFDRLVRALALVIGTEGAIVFKDVLELDDHEANAVRQWMIRALVGAALQDAKD